MSNCLTEAAVQAASKQCSCIPGDFEVSNESCFGESLNCFMGVYQNLGLNMSRAFSEM